MRAILYLSAVVLLAVCATWAYRVNYATQDALNRVADLRGAIAEEREALGVLKAEWGYLNRPDRLRQLVSANAEALGLVDLSPDQFGDVSEVPFRPAPPPANPLGDGLGTGSLDPGAGPRLGTPGRSAQKRAGLMTNGAIQ